MVPAQEIKQSEFLRSLGDQYLSHIAKIALPKDYAAEKVIFRQGEGSQFIYCVLTGSVGLSVEEAGQNPVEVSRIGPGELLGWSPVLGRHAMTATAKTLTPCRLAVLDVHEILSLCESDPRFGVVFLRQIALVVSERLWGMRRNLARAMSHRPLIAALSEGSD